MSQLQQLGLRVSPETKAKLDAIWRHHVAQGTKPSLGDIVSKLIEREHKKLKLEQ